jgi:hypothetical protein
MHQGPGWANNDVCQHFRPSSSMRFVSQFWVKGISPWIFGCREDPAKGLGQAADRFTGKGQANGLGDPNAKLSNKKSDSRRQVMKSQTCR